MKRFLIILMLISGCATTPARPPLDQSKLSLVKEGITTKQEIVDLFGNPNSIELTAEAKQIMIYRYPVPRYSTALMSLSGRIEADYQTLQFLIDENGTVEKHILNFDTSQISAY